MQQQLFNQHHHSEVWVEGGPLNIQPEPNALAEGEEVLAPVRQQLQVSDFAHISEDLSQSRFPQPHFVSTSEHADTVQGAPPPPPPAQAPEVRPVKKNKSVSTLPITPQPVALKNLHAGHRVHASEVLFSPISEPVLQTPGSLNNLFSVVPQNATALSKKAALLQHARPVPATHSRWQQKVSSMGGSGAGVQGSRSTAARSSASLQRKLSSPVSHMVRSTAARKLIGEESPLGHVFKNSEFERDFEVKRKLPHLFQLSVPD